jgi:hypothetical protein
MERKQAEADFANMIGRMSTLYEGALWAHKWADMRACPHCGQLLYKVEDNVDYTMIVGNIAGLVECKQDEERFRWADEGVGIRPGQRAWLNEWQLQRRPSWLFLEMGDGRAPKDRNAWLIWWPVWLMHEGTLELGEKKSLAWRETRQSGGLNAVSLLADWQLDWVPNQGFVIPGKHQFWTMYKNQIKFKTS